MRMRRIVVAVTAVLGLIVAFADPAAAAPTHLFAVMDGAQEVPGPGDPDGRGVGIFDVFPNTGKVCVSVRYRNIDPATAMHIHAGAAGVPGGIVVDLTPVLSGTKCVFTSTTTAKQIKNNPQNFYCNIHNGSFSAGAIRGQLELAQN